MHLSTYQVYGLCPDFVINLVVLQTAHSSYDEGEGTENAKDSRVLFREYLANQMPQMDVPGVNDSLGILFLLSLCGEINDACHRHDNQAVQNVFFTFHVISKLMQRNYFDIFEPEGFGL